MKKRNQEIRDLCEFDYPNWLWSRKKYVKPLPMNILQQFQPQKTYEEKDYPNSPLCAAFHLAILNSFDRDKGKAMCFLYVFFPRARPKPIKTLAFDLNVDKDTVYEWAHSTAITILSTAKSSVKVYEMMAKEDFNFDAVVN